MPFLVNTVFRQYLPSNDAKTRVLLSVERDWRPADLALSDLSEEELRAEGHVNVIDQLPSPDRSVWIFIDHESRTYVIPPPIRNMPMPRSKTYGHAPVQFGCEMRLLTLGGVPEGYTLTKSLANNIFMVARYFLVNEDAREYTTIPNGVGSPAHVLPVWPRFDAWVGRPGRCYMTTERPAGYTCLDDQTVQRITIVNDERREYAVCDPTIGNLALPYRWASRHYAGVPASAPDWGAPEGYTEVPPSLFSGTVKRASGARFLVNHTRREYIALPEQTGDGVHRITPPEDWKDDEDEIEGRPKPPRRYTLV